MTKKSSVAERNPSTLAAASCAAIAPKIDALRTVLLPNAPSRSTVHHGLQSDNAKPTERELSPRQLAVARALARGGPIFVIARDTQTSRHTIARWRRLPKFQAELKRLHELLATQSRVPSSASVAIPSRPPPRATHAIDRKLDKMIDEYLGRGMGKR